MASYRALNRPTTAMWWSPFLAVLLTLSSTPLGQSSSFGGANSFYLYSYRTNDQLQVLDAMKGAGFKTLRIFISSVGANAKGSNNFASRDVENPVGTYDDSILSSIDDLMLRASQRGIKLIIALHDRYLLGCWGTDAYVSKYNIPVTNDCGGADIGANDLSGFYNSAAAATDMDRRFAHIVAHKNPNFGNRPWSSIPEAVFGFDIQNEGQAHQRNWNIPNRNWICDRARNLKPRLSAGVLVHTGGGAAVWDSALQEHFDCPSIDVVSIHGYGEDWSSSLPPVIQRAQNSGKRIIVEEFGSTGWDSKAGGLQSQISVFNARGVPWMVWQVNKPNNGGDYEVFTDDTASWSVLSNGAKAAAGLAGAFRWPELSGGDGGGAKPPPPGAKSPPPTKKPPPPPTRKPPPPSDGGGKCDKCNVSLCRGGCKCDNNCDCRWGLGGAACDKCNMAQDQGGCKCDDNCNCRPGSCWS